MKKFLTLLKIEGNLLIPPDCLGWISGNRNYSIDEILPLGIRKESK